MFSNLALTVDPKHSKVYEHKADALRNLVRIKDSITCYDKAIKLDPQACFAYRSKELH